MSLWDSNTGQAIVQLEEHEKRVWSVDFSRTDPTQLASGSDDTKGVFLTTLMSRYVLLMDI